MILIVIVRVICIAVVAIVSIAIVIRRLLAILVHQHHHVPLQVTWYCSINVLLLRRRIAFASASVCF